jgi:hypothetical protein
MEANKTKSQWTVFYDSHRKVKGKQYGQMSLSLAQDLGKVLGKSVLANPQSESGGTRYRAPISSSQMNEAGK